MLKKRIMTAAVILPVFLAAILFLPKWPFALFTLSLFSLGAWEWSRMAGLKAPLTRIGYTLFIIQMLTLGLQKLSPEYFNLFFGMACSLWLIYSLGVCFYPKGQAMWKNKGVAFVVGGVVLVPSCLALNWLRALYGYPFVLAILLLIAFADTAAYFTGKKWGMHKLMPQVSPGKTLEGAAGALAGTLVLALGLHTCCDSIHSIPLVKWLMLSEVTVLFALFGDLFESLYKRCQNLKDSGALLPGHGGILGRIDGFTAGLPLFLLGLLHLLPPKL